MSISHAKGRHAAYKATAYESHFELTVRRLHGSTGAMETYRLHHVARHLGAVTLVSRPTGKGGRTRGFLCALLLGAAALAACGESPDAGGEVMTPWPFTVDQVALSCEPGRRLFVTTNDGRRFAVNGTARAEAELMREIQNEVDLQPLIQRGLALCRDNDVRTLRLYRPVAESAPPPPAARRGARIEPLEIREGLGVKLEADQVINGRRPELYFSCSPGRAPMIQLDLIQAPRTPPPLRGVFATFRIGGQSVRVEMSWSTGSRWTLRSGDDRALDQQLVRMILEERAVAFVGSSDFMPSSTLTWTSADIPQARRPTVAEACTPR